MKRHPACGVLLPSLVLVALGLAVLPLLGQFATNVAVAIIADTAVVGWQGDKGVTYRVEQSSNVAGPWRGIDAPVSAFSQTNLMILPSAFFRVAIWSNSYPNDTERPAIPANFAGTVDSCRQVTLSWIGATDPGTGASGTSEYLIYRGAAFFKSVPHTDGEAAFSITDANVSDSRPYSYQIAALDRAGNVSARSEVLSVTTLACPCAGTISSTAAQFDASGGEGGFSFTTSSACPWTATATNHTWIHTTSSGSGSGTVHYTVEPNSDTNARSGTITLAGETFTVEQAGVTCRYALNEASSTLTAAAGSGCFGVTALGGCSWSATASEPWLHTTSFGSGDGTVQYSVSGNGGTNVRSGTITVSEQAFTVTQAGAAEPDLVAPSAILLAPAAGAVLSGQVSLVAQVTDNVSVASAEFFVDQSGQWISIGSNVVSGTICTNAMTLDTTQLSEGAHILLCLVYDTAGNSFFATLGVSVANANCRSVLTSASGSHPATAESGSFGVTAAAGCLWSAVTSQTWMHTTSSGSGNGTVNYTVDANPSPISRSGIIAVGGQNFTVSQAGMGGNPTFSPARSNHTAAAESGSFDVTVTEGSAWIVTANQPWLHTTNSGIGSGTVVYTLDANDSTNSRSGFITVAGQDFTVEQAGMVCRYTLNAANGLHTAAAESGSFGVIASGGCSWSATVNQSWIQTTSSGNGSGTVSYTLEANSSTNSRSGVIQVSGQTFTVNQAAMECSYSLNSASSSHTAATESGEFDVTAPASCGWSATVGPAWIQTTSSGNGSGRVSYTVAANSDTNSRSGFITVNERSFTVTQAGAAGPDLVPPSATLLSPSSGTALSGKVSLIAQLTDNVGVASVEFFVDHASEWVSIGSNVVSGAVCTNAMSMDTTQVSDGAHKLLCLVHDTAKNGALAMREVVVANSACRYSLNSTNASFSAGSQSGSFAVTEESGCNWSATASQPWIHTTSSGSGSGPVSYTVDTNGSLNARSGVITVGGQDFTVNQAGMECNFTLDFAIGNHTGAPASGSFRVIVQDGCSWSATASQPWIHTTSSGNGNGTVDYTVDANHGPDSRSGIITVGDQVFLVIQAWMDCRSTLSAASSNHSAAAASGSFSMTTLAGCLWSATANQPWIQTTNRGNGSGTVDYSVEANGSLEPRSGTITVGGQDFTVTQAGMECNFTLDSASGDHTAAAASGSFGVIVQDGCSWSATANQPWIHTTSSGNGSGTVSYSVEANVSAVARAGTITVGGQTFTMHQAGVACIYTLSCLSTNCAAETLSDSFMVMAPAGCDWSATANQPWIQTTNRGHGSGPVDYTVEANGSLEPRSGTITVGGQDFTVNQAAMPCRYTLNPIGGSHTGAAESGSFGVTASAGCGWGATASQSWIHTASSGNGNGTVDYAVDANPGSASRSGIIMVGDQVFVVIQAWMDCSSMLSAVSGNHPAAAASGSFGVTTLAGCLWSAMANEPWIQTTNSGNGSGTVSYTVEANGSINPRSGVITVGGQDFTVTQAGMECSYTLNSASGSHTAAAEIGSFGVTAPGGCSWSATANQPWIHTTSSGNGSGPVAYTVDANAGSNPRSGTITVGDQTFTVDQAGVACIYTLSCLSTNCEAGTLSDSFMVAAPAGCDWSATANQPWIQTTNSGNGSGAVDYTVEANGSLEPRSGTITVGGQDFTVNQAGTPCIYTLAPANGNHTGAAASGSFGVTAQAGCLWNATASHSWIQTTSSGNGNGTVDYTVDANPGSASRSGIITVGDQVFVVIQTWMDCSSTLSPASSNHSAAAASGSFSVTTLAGCLWSATANQPWIQTTNGGNGSGTVAYTLEANGSLNPRSGVITVGSQDFTVTQAGMECIYTLNSVSGSHAAAAEIGSFDVMVPGGCNWSATADQPWIHTSSSGNGNGTVSCAVDANTTATPRTGTITVGGQQFTVHQAGVPCIYTLNSTSTNCEATTLSDSFMVTAPVGCDWSAKANEPWIQTTNTGNGSGAVDYTVEANGSLEPRSGTITVGGQDFTVNQAGMPCNYTLDAASGSHTGAAASGSFGVTAPDGCGWSATAIQPWIHTASSGNGNGTVDYTVDANHGLEPRSGIITVGDQVFVVIQAWMDCRATLNSVSGNHPAAAASGSFGVTTLAGCLWSATANQPWIHTTSSGSGDGTVEYTVDANNGTSPRSGTIAVGGRDFTVNQAGIECRYTLNSTSGFHAAVGASGSFSVTAQAGCNWSATAGQTWIHTTSSGSGDGVVNYTVDANPSVSPRSGAITVNGETFTVDQVGITCSYVLSTTSASHGAGAESGSFGMTAQAGCTWSATAGQTWIHTTSSGTGDGMVNYTVDANTSANSRSGAISVDGQTFTVNQVGIICSYVLNPAIASHAAGVESGSFGMTAQAGCTWSATAGQTWIHTTSSGSGSGTVQYTVDANTSVHSRSGTISVNGQTFTVNQLGITCSYGLTTTSASCDAGVVSGTFGVTAQSGCTWSATANRTWLHTTSSGNGSGTLNYVVDENSSSSVRSGTITVGGHIFTLTQAAGNGCNYVLNPTGIDCNTGGFSGTFGVSSAGCSWVATADQDWIHTASYGTGNGQVAYTVDANDGMSRRWGTITVNDQTYGVCQAGTTTNDGVAPVVTFLAPSQGAALSGQVVVRARLTDNWSLDRAVFYMHDAQATGGWRSLGTNACARVVSTNAIGFDSTTVSNGSHLLMCVAYDSAGNAAYATRGVSIANVVPDPGLSRWLKEMVRPTGSGDAAGAAVKTDAQGNVIVVGNFKGTAAFGNITQASLGGADIFICKFDPAGNLSWVKTFGGTFDDLVNAVAIDAFGNILVTGAFTGTANFGGTNMTSGDGVYGSDIFVAKYSGAGVPLWCKQLGGTNGNNCGAGIAVDPVGDVVVTGTIYGHSDLGDGPIHSQDGGADGFVVKLAGTTGGGLWSKNFGGTLSDFATSVAVDSRGNVVVVGKTYSSIDFGGGLVANAGGVDLFLVKYAGNDGHYLWSRQLGGSGPDSAENVAVDSANHVFVTGSYAGQVDFGGAVLTPPFEGGIYLANYTEDGILDWARSIAYETAGGTIFVRGIALDSVGNVAITGSATGGVDFGSGTLSYGGSSFFVAKYGPEGNYLWAKCSANTGRCGGYGIATDKDRNVLTTGSVSGEAVVDGFRIASPDVQIRSGFLLKVSP